MSYVVTVTANNRAAPSVSVTTGTGSATISVSTGSRGPIGNGTAIVQSETPPTNTAALWFDPSTGVYSIYNGNAWVVTSGLGSSSGTSAADIAPVAVADSTERKLAATYTALDVTLVNGLRVIQDDLPDVVWTLLDTTDITDDANWYGGPRTNASGQLPLSGVKLIDGQIPLNVGISIAVSDSRWYSSTVGGAVNIMKIADATIPAAFMTAGKKMSCVLRYRFLKNSTGVSTSLGVALVPKAFYDAFIADPNYVNSSISYFPVTFFSAGSSLDIEGETRSVHTLTAVTGTTTNELRMVASSAFVDTGRIWDSAGAAIADNPDDPTSSADTANLANNFIANEDAQVVVLLLGGPSAEGKSYELSAVGGYNFISP